MNKINQPAQQETNPVVKAAVEAEKNKKTFSLSTNELVQLRKRRKLIDDHTYVLKLIQSETDAYIDREIRKKKSIDKDWNMEIDLNEGKIYVKPEAKPAPKIHTSKAN